MLKRSASDVNVSMIRSRQTRPSIHQRVARHPRILYRDIAHDADAHPFLRKQTHARALDSTQQALYGFTVERSGTDLPGREDVRSQKDPRAECAWRLGGLTIHGTEVQATADEVKRSLRILSQRFRPTDLYETDRTPEGRIASLNFQKLPFGRSDAEQ